MPSGGVMVRLVTGDNLDAAKTVARRCNISMDDENAMDASKFRKLGQLDGSFRYKFLPLNQTTNAF